MTRTRNTANMLKLRVNNVDQDVKELTNNIESFGDPEISMEFLDMEDTSQIELNGEFEGFVQILSELDDDFCSEAADVSTKLKLINSSSNNKSIAKLQTQRAIPHNRRGKPESLQIPG